MAELTPPGFLQNGANNARQARLIATRDLGPGVWGSWSQLTNADGGMRASGVGTNTLTVQAGGCYVSAGTDQGLYACQLDGTAVLTIPAQGAGSARTDLIVARVYDTSFLDAGPDRWVVERVDGTATAPAPPALPARSLQLHSVTVNASSSVINSIADGRRYPQMNVPLTLRPVFSQAPTLAVLDTIGNSTFSVSGTGVLFASAPVSGHQFGPTLGVGSFNLSCMNFTPKNGSDAALALHAQSPQTVDLFRTYDAAGTVRLTLTPTGALSDLTTNNHLLGGPTITANTLTVYSTAANGGLGVRQAAGGQAQVFRGYDTSGTLQSNITGAGDATFLSVTAAGSSSLTTLTTSTLTVNGVLTANSSVNLPVLTVNNTGGVTATTMSVQTATSEVLRLNAAASQSGLILNVRSSTPTTIASITSTGNVQGTGAYTSLSDLSSKENVEYLPDNGSLEKVLSLRPAKFDYIDGDKQQIGFVAQDVQEVLPEAISPIFEGDMLGLRDTAITALLVQAVKELSAKVDALVAA